MRERYQIVDYTMTSGMFIEYRTVDDWINALGNRSKSHKVQAYYLYQTPLKNISSETTFTATTSNTSVGSDLIVNAHYRVVVFKISAHLSAGNDMYVSFERKDALHIAQITTNDKNDVVRKLQGIKRKVAITEITSEQMNGFLPLECLNLPVIINIFINWDLNYIFELLSQDNQNVTSETMSIIQNTFNTIKLKLPGRKKTVDFDSDEILDYIKNRFPSWKEKLMTKIPDIKSDVSVATCDNTIHTDVVSIKRRIYNALYEALSTIPDNRYWKVILYDPIKEKLNLSNESMTSSEIVNIDTNVVGSLSVLLRHFLPFTFITNKAGILIFQVDESNQSHEKNIDIESECLRKKYQLICELQHLKASFVHMIYIYPNKPCSKSRIILTRQKKKQIMRQVFYVDFANKEEVKTMCRTLWENCHKSAVMQDDKRLQLLTAQLATIKNCESVNILFPHHTISNQTWGVNKVIMWTPEQRELICLATSSFGILDNGLRLFISGCPGSGKTSILIYIAKLYISFTGEKVLICLDRDQSNLISSVKDYISTDMIMRGKAIVKTDGNLNITNTGLIAIDELKPHHLLVLQNISQKQHVIISSSKTFFTQQTVNAHVMEGDLKFQCKMLRGNCRSPPQICNLVARFQNKVCMKGAEDKRRNIPVEVVTDNENGCLKVEIVDDPSQKREELLQMCTKEIYNQLEEYETISVVIVSHLSFHSMLRGCLLDVNERVLFLDSIQLLGSECTSLIIVLDLACCIPTYTEITNIMARTSSSLTCIINKSKTPFKLGKVNCFQTKIVNRSILLQFSRDIESEVGDSGGMILVNNSNLMDVELTRLVECNFSNKFELYRQGTWRNGIARARFVTLNTAYMIDINPSCGKISRNCHSPYIQLLIDSKIDGSNDIDRRREVIINFFERVLEKYEKQMKHVNLKVPNIFHNSLSM